MFSAGTMKGNNSSAKSKSTPEKNKKEDSAKSKSEKSIFSVAPIAEFDKSPPSTLEEVLTVGDPTPPTEAIDDLVSAQSGKTASNQSKK